MDNKPRRRLEPLRIDAAEPPGPEHPQAAQAGARKRTGDASSIVVAVGCGGAAVLGLLIGLALLFRHPSEASTPAARVTPSAAAAPAATTAAPTCEDCSYTGTYCDESRKCRLKPGARWSVSPWMVTFKPQPGILYGGSGGIQPSFCVRKPGMSEWTCADFDDKRGSGGTYSRDSIVFSGAPSIVVTTEELFSDGIDLEVRTWGDARATRLGARHDEGLVAGKRLFSGGLKFGLNDKAFPTCLVKLEPVE